MRSSYAVAAKRSALRTLALSLATQAHALLRLGLELGISFDDARAVDSAYGRASVLSRTRHGPLRLAVPLLRRIAHGWNRARSRLRHRRRLRPRCARRTVNPIHHRRTLSRRSVDHARSELPSESPRPRGGRFIGTGSRSNDGAVVGAFTNLLFGFPTRKNRRRSRDPQTPAPLSRRFGSAHRARAPSPHRATAAAYLPRECFAQVLVSWFSRPHEEGRRSKSAAPHPLDRFLVVAHRDHLRTLSLSTRIERRCEENTHDVQAAPCAPGATARPGGDLCSDVGIGGRLDLLRKIGFGKNSSHARDFQTILVHDEGRVIRITLNRPDRRNALSTEMLEELIAAFRSVRDAKDARVVVLRGAGDRAFAREPISQRCRRGKRAQAHDARGLFPEVVPRDPRSSEDDACRGQRSLPRRWCRPHALLRPRDCESRRDDGDTEIARGLFPFMISPLILDAVGRRRAFEMMLLGDTFSAEEAASIGLVNRRTVSGDSLRRDGREWAQKTRPSFSRGPRPGRRALVTQGMPLEAHSSFFAGSSR